MTLGESSRAEVTKRRRSLDMKEVLTKEVPTEEIAPVGLAANAAPTRAGGMWRSGEEEARRQECSLMFPET
ncbi:hypothetical protein CLOP_g19581 [Closterium sp. NIES-67]|nr:hypothetical protein CLOP_g19581 [Closterium sp. NIES-67]